MENETFLAGAIQDHKREFYIERECDYEVIKNLLMGNYVTLLEPRQQGKTSLLHALRRRPELYNTSLLYVDVSTLNRSNAMEWYSNLCDRLNAQLPPSFDRQQPAQAWVNTSDWRAYLSQLALAAREHNQSVVIALDEIATAKFEGSNEFFAVMREVFNSREPEPQFQSLSFILSGTISTHDLMPDLRVSPFNISKRVRLEDFNAEELILMAQKHHFPEELLSEVGLAVHANTSGQPYLSQSLLMLLSADVERKRIAEAGVKVVVDQVTNELISADYNHLRALRNRLNDLLERKDWDYLEELSSILTGDSSLFYPTMIAWQEQLELAGLIKQGEDGRCQIRCKIYEAALALWINSAEKAHRSSTGSTLGDLFETKLDNFIERIREISLEVQDYDKQIRKGPAPREKVGLRIDVDNLEKRLEGCYLEYETYRATRQARIRQDFNDIKIMLDILKMDIQRLKKGLEA